MSAWPRYRERVPGPTAALVWYRRTGLAAAMSAHLACLAAPLHDLLSAVGTASLHRSQAFCHRVWLPSPSSFHDLVAVGVAERVTGDAIFLC